MTTEEYSEDIERIIEGQRKMGWREYERRKKIIADKLRGTQ